MKLVRKPSRRQTHLLGGLVVAGSTVLGAVAIPFVLRQINDEPPVWLRPLTTNTSAWLAILTAIAITLGVTLHVLRTPSADDQGRAAMAAPSKTAGESTNRAEPADDIKVRVLTETPIVDTPDGVPDVGHDAVIVAPRNNGSRTVIIRDWGFELRPSHHTVPGHRRQPCGKLGFRPVRLRPGEEIRFNIEASVLRLLAADKHVSFADILAYIELDQGVRVYADTGVPLE